MKLGSKQTATFMNASRPLMPDLLVSATHHIRYHQAIGDLTDELSPEELVGETLIRACDREPQRPRGVSLRSWLLTLETRTLDDLIARRTEEQKLWSFSLDQPIPTPTATDFDDSFWDWYQPDPDVPSMADEVAGPKVATVEAQEALEAETNWMAELDTPTWRAWFLHEIRSLSLLEVCSSLRLTKTDARDRIDHAWSTYRRSARSNPDVGRGTQSSQQTTTLDNTMTQPPTVLELHSDHRQWQSQASMWKLDVQAWRAEHKMALDALSEVVKLIDQHSVASSMHDKAVESFSKEVSGHEHRLAKHSKRHAYNDIGDPKDVAGHAQAKETAKILQQVHERIKKQHHIAMAQVMSLQAAFEAAM